jgi:hypothetical protein
VNLAEYQRAVLRVSYALDPRDGDFESLGDVERFRMYRAMIRNRLRDMAHVAFKQSLSALGATRFDACFDRYLEASPPRSPLIRDVVADFGPFARIDPLLREAVPAYLGDLLRFEEVKWRVAYAPAALPKIGEDGVRELDFEGIPVLNPSLVVLALEHAVHTLPAAPPAPSLLQLLVYRPPAGDDVRWYAAEPLFAEIVARARDGTHSLTDLVRAAAAHCGLLLDAALLDTLATSLTLALSRGVVIGVR